jgi:molybdopterin-containing oxidoreductase family membrane subunit
MVTAGAPQRPAAGEPGRRQRPAGDRSEQASAGRLYWLVVALLAALVVAGLAALGSRLAGGPEPRERWGYLAASLAFLLAAAQSGPVLAFVSRLGRGNWGVPLRRPAELFGLAGLLTTPLLVVLLGQLPPPGERPSIWFGWPGAPLIWDTLAAALLGLLGLVLLAVSAGPDLTVRLAGWLGASRQWAVLTAGLIALGALYSTLYVFLHLLVASDLALSLVPGWSSAIFPASQAVSGLSSGLALSLLALAAIERFGHPARPDDSAPYRAAGKLLLAFALLWFYFWWSEFLTYWYGRRPDEQWLLSLLMFGPSFWLFLAVFGLNFLLPTALLIWNPIRNSRPGPMLAAGLVLLGTLLDRLRIYGAAWSVADFAEQTTVPPAIPWPDPLDLLLLLSGPAALLLLVLLATRVVPPRAEWEVAAAERLRVEQRYLQTRVEMVGRTD